MFVSSAATSRSEPAWRTAFVKRGFVGTYKTEWAGGLGATLRNRAPLAFSGLKVRVVLRSDFGAESDISKLTLAPIGSGPGVILGDPTTVTFGAKQDVMIPARSNDIVSDEITAKIKSGVWFVQESFSSTTYPYAYSVNNPGYQAGDQHVAPKLTGQQRGAWLGNAYRVDVLTTDTRPLIVCYGDSITAGYNSTPDASSTYPELLSKLTGRPVLNMGVNGDIITQNSYCAKDIRALDGVNIVLFLMGVNDILNGSVKSLDKYQLCASNVIKQLHEGGIKVYWGTIPPFKGYKAAYLDGTQTLDPAKEALRKQINEWILSLSGADGVVNYDQVLADPYETDRLNPLYQSDWLHPNDAGYAQMAAAAAAELKSDKSASK